MLLLLLLTIMGFLASLAIVEERSEPEVALEITSFLKLQLSPAVRPLSHIWVPAHQLCSLGLYVPIWIVISSCIKGLSIPILVIGGSAGEGLSIVKAPP